MEDSEELREISYFRRLKEEDWFFNFLGGGERFFFIFFPYGV